MRKFFVIGIIAVILIAVPLVAYLLTTQKTTTQSGAAPSTVLSFTTPTDPVPVGTPIQIPVVVDPAGGGSTGNQVSFIKLTINYDGSKLQVGSTYYTPDPKFSTLLEGPSNNCNGTTCTITATVSTGADPNNAVSSQNNVATLTFTPLVPTNANTPTQLTFGSDSQVLSIASTDKPAENVLNRAQPGSVTIIAADVTPTDTGGGTQPTDTPTPIGGDGSSGGTTSGTTPTTTASPLTCNSLTADNTSSDTTPFTTLLTTVGTSSGGNISQVVFNYGDGNVDTITSGGGLGTTSVSVQQSHIYKTTGTFTATAVLSDDSGNTTSPSDCSITITVGGSGGTSDTPTPTQAIAANPTATPSIPATGPGNTIVGVGIAGAAIIVLGLAFAVFL